MDNISDLKQPNSSNIKETTELAGADKLPNPSDDDIFAFTVQDLQLITSLISVAAKEGIINAGDMSVCGDLYNKVIRIIEEVAG